VSLNQVHYYQYYQYQSHISQADVSEPLGSVAPLDGEIYRELVDWLLANSPPAPPINWHEQYNDLFASVEDAGNYTNFGALPQRYEGLFCSERQSSLLTTEHGVSMLPGNIDERGRHLYPRKTFLTPFG